MGIRADADDSFVRRRVILLIRIGSRAGRYILREITSALEPEARSSVWCLLALEGVARGQVMGRGVLALEEAVNDSPNGLPLTWDDVKELADAFTDVWEIRLIGALTASDVQRDTPLDSLVRRGGFVIDRFDSGDWLISCDPAACRARLLAIVGAEINQDL